jgi:tyrosinase
MATSDKIKTRVSILELQDAYTSGNKKPLEDLMRAWKGIKELPYDHPNSFFKLGGFHGEPFRGAGWGSNAYWGGYCNHGNVLFPTWHRVYLYKLELALQSIEGCSEVMLPYWDETNEESLKNGIPWALTEEFFELDGVKIPNPLRSFVFPVQIVDNVQSDDGLYTKPKNYETVRYPLSGLVGTPEAVAATKAHNAQYPDYQKNVEILNDNINNWLNSEIVVHGKVIPTNVHQKFKDCLEAPNYTVFSNTTSAAEWNIYLNEGETPVVALESPHNSIHLAVGGCDLPTYDRSPIDGANGDMGENDTAGLDPIFYFHHCNIDRVFWLWQKKHGCTDYLEIIPEYPGTNTVDNQGPTPGMAPNSWLTLDSPLNPFTLQENGKERTYTSMDSINIERQMGYTYSKGSLDDFDSKRFTSEEIIPSKIVKVSHINRAPIRGSFMISAYAMIDGERKHLGTEAVLSRWNSKYCANCQTHIEARAFFKLPIVDTQLLKGSAEGLYDNLEVEVKGRQGLLSGIENNKLLKSDGTPAIKFKIEVV